MQYTKSKDVARRMICGIFLTRPFGGIQEMKHGVSKNEPGFAAREVDQLPGLQEFRRWRRSSIYAVVNGGSKYVAAGTRIHHSKWCRFDRAAKCDIRFIGNFASHADFSIALRQSADSFVLATVVRSSARAPRTRGRRLATNRLKAELRTAYRKVLNSPGTISFSGNSLGDGTTNVNKARPLRCRGLCG